MTRHPLGKNGRNISLSVYKLFTDAIITILKDKELSHTELLGHLNKRLKKTFAGNINWYGETVKLDLEARNIIQRTSTKPEKYKLV